MTWLLFCLFVWLFVFRRHSSQGRKEKNRLYLFKVVDAVWEYTKTNMLAEMKSVKNFDHLPDLRLHDYVAFVYTSLFHELPPL
jgi:hypothetical protein